MNLYKHLTKLLAKNNEIRNLENLKKVKQPDKEKAYKNFIETLIDFYKCEIKTEESKKFKKYWIEYLKDYIINSISFSSPEEKKEIENILKEYYPKQFNNINIDDMKNKKSENYELNSLGINYIDNSDNEPTDCASEINNNYNNDKNNYNNKNNFKLNDLNRNNKININPSNEINKENNFKNDFIHNHNNIAPKFNQNKEINQEMIQKENKNIQLKMVVHSNNIINEGHINDYKYLKNENIGKNDKKINMNNIIINKQNNINNINVKENKTNIRIDKNEIRENNFDIIENNDTSMSSYGINKTNLNINAKSDDKFKDNNTEKNNKINKNDIKKNENISNIDNKKKEDYEKEIENYYNKIFFKDNITQCFIKFLTNKLKSKILSNLNSKIFSSVQKNRKIIISQIWKEKLITLICVLFPFAKGENSKIKDKDIFQTEDKIDKNLFEYLRTNILIQDKTKTRNKLFEFSQDNMDNFVKNFCSNLYLSQNEEGKNTLFFIYTFLIITRNLRKFSDDSKFFDDLLAKEYLISFKIKFILEHQEFYSEISKDIIGVYNGLLFINIFYNEIFGKGKGKNEYNIIKKDNKTGKYIFGDTKFELTIDRNCDFNINRLFSEKDNLVYKKVMENLSHFYSINQAELIDINALINFSTSKIFNKESNFIINLVEDICAKEKYIYNNFENYKNNLQKLEECIYNLGIENLNLQKSKTQIKSFAINDTQRKVFDSLIKDIKENIYPNNIFDKFGLYPYGSITQFLGGQKSDIDIYLYIKDNNYKVSILKKLCSAINKIIKKSPHTVISRRLCVIKFKYQSQDYPETDFDISLMGFCPYLHSVLLRTYSLMDPRFSLLAITLKKFLGFLGLKSQEDKPDFLNSFSWMILLVTFLQDIIKPKILPKILSNNNNSYKLLQIQYGNNYSHDKSFESFVSNMKEENTYFLENLYDKNHLMNIYHEEIEKNGKNNMSCAEIFLSFLEFVIYYFKSDAVYANCSIEFEGYESMNNILKYNEIKNLKDEGFADYFKYKYFKKISDDRIKIKDGLILIRDPLDPHYNPAHTLINRSYNIFMEKLKLGYLYLLKNGDLYGLEKEFKKKK